MRGSREFTQKGEGVGVQIPRRGLTKISTWPKLIICKFQGGGGGGSGPPVPPPSGSAHAGCNIILWSISMFRYDSGDLRRYRRRWYCCSQHYSIRYCRSVTFEPQREKTGLRGFRTGPTQTDLCNNPQCSC